MLEVPAVLAQRASQCLGAAGRDWAEHLPEIISAAQGDWSLIPRKVLPLGKELSLLIAVTAGGGQPAVLKASYPGTGPQREAAALAHWAGRGAAALLAADPGRGLLLLEQLAARRSLAAVNAATALPVAARVLQQLWVPPPQHHAFPAAADQARRWLTCLPGRYRQLGQPFEPGLLHAALAAAGNLTAARAGPLLLHGDFHRGNVLGSNRAGWLAIDPCPVTGDPDYDIADLAADFLDDHVGQPAATRELATVLHDLSRAIPHLDPLRARDWMLAKRIALALDSIAATGDGEWDLAFARLLTSLPGQQPD